MATEHTVPSFEHAAMEADMKRLAVEIQGQRERPELTNVGEKEIVKEAIRAFPVLEKKPSDAPAPANFANSPLPAYAQSAPPATRLEIEYLLDITLKQGLSKALSEAHKSSYFVQDAFHDALVGRLYPELQKRGIVK